MFIVFGGDYLVIVMTFCSTVYSIARASSCALVSQSVAMHDDPQALI